MLRPAEPDDTPVLVSLAVATGLFQPAEADALLRNVLDELHAGTLGPGHAAEVWLADIGEPPAGWVYFAPSPKADGVWDLWWIGVAPACHGRGIGDELLRFVEHQARAAGGRLLIIETSSLPALARTRQFYANRNYLACGTIPDFYGDGDGKVTFAKRLG